MIFPHKSPHGLGTISLALKLSAIDCFVLKMLRLAIVAGFVAYTAAQS